MNFTQAVSSGFSRYFDFRSRSSRSEYWWWTLFSVLLSVVATVFDAALFGGAAVLDTLSSVTLFVPGLAVGARRLHDIGRSAWWLLIILTIIGIFVLFYWAVQPGIRGSNKYGLDPLLPYAEPDFPDFEGASGTFGSQDPPGFCAACGTVSEPDANFCRSCGAAV